MGTSPRASTGVSPSVRRTILSTAAPFPVTGSVPGVMPPASAEEIIGAMAEPALCTVSFLDGRRIGWKDPHSARWLPARALCRGLPEERTIVG